MSEFGLKNNIRNSSIVDNNVVNPFANPSKLKNVENQSLGNSFKETDTLKKTEQNTNTPFSSGNSKTLNKLSAKTTLSREEITAQSKLPQINELSIESKKNVSLNKNTPAKATFKKEPNPFEVLKTRFEETTVESIKRFENVNTAPYPKEYKCGTAEIIITNTSLIEDMECSPIYTKTPFNLAIDIFDHEKIKNDPELKTKVSSLMSLIGPNDKAALAYTRTLLDRKPPVSDEKVKVLLDKLISMLNTSYDPRIGETKAFVVSALHDISMPSDISQEGIGTCAGTSVQIQLAIRNPEEYLKMIDSLAKNQPYTTVKGFNVQPNFTFANEGGTNHDTRRTISAKIMQNTIMDYADAETRSFDSAKNDAGITTTQTAKALREIVGIDVENYYTWDYSGTQLLDMLKKSNPSHSNPVEISLSYEPQGRDALHSVNVVALDDNNVTISNPWGREETFPVSELKPRILSVSNSSSIDKGIISVNPKDQNLKNKLADDSLKADLLNKISIKDKMELIENSVAPWNGQKYDLKDNLSPNDKKMIINILDELSQGGHAQNKVWLPRIKHFVPDLNLFLSKIDNNTDQFNKVKEKLLALNS